MIKKLNFLSISSVGSRKRPFSYRSRIKPVLFPYQPRIFLRSSFFRRSIVLASRSGNNTETIRNNTRSIYAGREDDTWRVDGEAWQMSGQGEEWRQPVEKDPKKNRTNGC